MIFGLMRMKVNATRSKNFVKPLLPIFIGLLASIVGQSTFVPPANASIFGTIYNAPVMAFGGGNYQGTQNCPTGQVIVGVTFNQNPMSWGYKCSALNANLEVPALSSTLRATANYVFCPDGKAAVGLKMFNSGGNRVGISCKTLPLVNDAEVLTDFVANAAATKFITRTTQTISLQTMCNAGDVVVAVYLYSNLYFDQLGAQCAPFTKFTVTYNVNGGSGTAPVVQQQTGPSSSITLSSAYAGARTGFQLSGWNTQANGLGVNYAAGASITPSTNLVLYAKWLSTITYNGNTNSGGTVPDPTIAVSSAAVTKLENNTGNLVKTGFTFGGWNTTANGSGTAYSGYGYATPLLRYVASDYDETTRVWTNSGSAGNTFNITSTNMGSGTGITKVSTTAGVGGSSNSFTTLKGGTNSKITFPNEASNNYTLCHVARYAGAAKQRIFTHPTVNWLSGYLSGDSGYYYGVGNNGSVGLLTGDTNWHLICDYNLNFRNNGTAGAAAGRTSLPANIGVATWSNQSSDWEIAEVLFYDVALGLTQIQEIEGSLSGTYGLSGYKTTAGTYASTGNTTLYAQWNSTITYNGNGQTSTAGSVPAATTANGTAANTTLANAGTMARSNYSFAGWNTQANGLGTNYASGLTTYQSTGNTTLYAKWTRTITYNSNGANSGAPERATDVFVNSATPSVSTFPTVGTMVKTGYTFAGWSTTTSGIALTTPYAAATEIPLYARWTANTYAVTYDTSTVTSGTMANTSLTAGTAFNLRANTFARTGFSFKNWNTASIGSGTTYAGGAQLTLYSDLTLYPQWNLLAPSVGTLDATAGNGEVTLTPTPGAPSSTVGATTSVTITAYTSQSTVSVFNPSKTCTVVAPATSCVITGLTNGTIYYFKSVATNTTGSSTFATYTPATPAGVVVSYRASDNGGIIGTTGSTGTTTATYNKPTVLTLPVATKADSVFSGWYTTQSSGGQLIGAAGATYTPTTAITLYARFAGVVYTISYNGNGNTGGTVPVNGSYQAGSSSGYNNTQSYDYTGTDQTFTIPNDITGTQEIQVEVWGAGGGGTVLYYGADYGGGAGGYTKATIATTTAGEVLTLKVGKGGTVRTTTSEYGGAGVGGNTSGLEGSSGGGYSGVFANTTPLAISGGGGGASPAHNDQGIAGGGGGANQNGGASTSTTMGGRGGTTSAGGVKAASCATDGAQYTGGNGCGAGAEAGGGGGAGYYGGGGGNSNGSANGGGGGGSGYLNPTRGSLTTATVGQNGALASTWAFPNKTSANYGSANAGRGGKGYTNTTTDSSGGNGRIVIQWKTGSGAYAILGSPTKVGYTFAGWNTSSTGNGTDYAVGASYSTNANLNLFAKWTPTARTVTFALDSGTSSASTSQLTGKFVGDTVALPAANTMSKTGYSFAGWSDGSSAFAGGATWTVPASDSNFTLTAQWTLSTLSYSYESNGGGTAPTGGTKSYGQSLLLDSGLSLSKIGFTFTGWNDGSTTSNGGTSIAITLNKVFVAQWSAQSFTISYSGNIPTSGSVASGSYVGGGVPYAIAANGFTKDGYTFAGWKDASNNSYAIGAGYSTAANLALIAQWTPSSYIISYNGNGSTLGSAPSSATLTTGTPFNASTNSGSLAKAGYAFAGWNTNAAGTGTNIAENGVITTTTNLILYAKWSIISPTITFNSGAASVTVPQPTSSEYGSLFTLPTTDTATVISSGNYIFTGWSDGTNIYQASSTYRMGTANVLFTAQWVAVFTVRYVLNGGTGTPPTDVLRENNFKETLTSATISKTGFTLSGWKDQSGTNIPPGATNWVISNSSYVAFAQWTATPRTLSFALDSGSGDAPVDITGKIIGEIVVLPTTSSTKVGYTFGGWSSGGVTYPAGGTFTVGDSNAAFVAVWISNTNKIIYNGNGATGGTTPTDGSFVTGAVTQYTVSTNTGNLEKTGFTFDGWYTTASGTGGTAYAVTPSAATLITNTNLILYAKWTAASFAITYDTAGGSTPPSSTNNAYGSSVTLPIAPTKAGSNFLGWETGTGASVNLYAPEANYVMGSSAVAFIARWSGISYAVTYDLNGGSGAAPTQANVSSGGSFTTAVIPTKNGFTFSGWSDGATTTNASTIISNLSGNITLTAQWTIALPGTPGIPTATPGNGSATITIAAPTTGGVPSSYTVTASPNGATCTVTAPGTSCTIAPLSNGTSYTFTTTATNTAGSSTSASSASAAVTPAGVPTSPTGVSGTGTGGTVNVAWTVPSSDGGSAISDYIVEYSVDGSGTWATFADGTSSATSATVTGLIAGNAYEFRITAKNLIGNSLPSFSSPTIETLPSAPAITTVTSASEQVTVTWNIPTHLGSGTITGDEYVVTAYDSVGNEAGSCKPASGQTTCIVTGLDNGSSYTFKVAVVTTVGTSAQSSASAVVVPAGVPSTPANIVAVTSGSNMTVTFDSPADNGGSAITSYIVTSSPAGATCTVGANATTYTCTGLTAGTNYSFSVKAVNLKGQSSASLDSTAVTAVAAPSAPLNVSAVITAGTTTLSATVSFDAPATNNGSDVTSYTVTASPGGATCTVSAPTTYCDIPILPDRVYTFTARATNAVGTSVASTTTLEIKATNGIAPTLVVDPIPAPTGDLVEAQVLNSNVTPIQYNSTPNSVITYQWKRCIDPIDDTTCTDISGATSTTYTLATADVDKYIRVATTATNSIGTVTNLSEATAIITALPVATPPTSTPPTNTPSVEPEPAPVVPSCNASCQAIRDAATAKAVADASAKAAADKLAADAAAKLKADAAATTASTKAAADAAAAAAAAKAAVEKAGAAAAAKAIADAAAATAAAQAKAAADAQAAAAKAAADAVAALKNSTTKAAAKAAATKSANTAAAAAATAVKAAATAVKAAATAAQQAAKAKTTADNANKQVDIAINSLNSKTAASQASAQANTIAAAAKAAANEAAAAAATKAVEAKSVANTAQKVAADTAARIATEQKEAATAAAAAKAAADAAAKAITEKIAADAVATKATQELAKVLEEKATLAEQAAKATNETVRAEIQKKIDEVSIKVEEVQKSVDAATIKADEAATVQNTATQTAETANKEAQVQATEAVTVKAESASRTAAASKAAAAATVAAKVATAAKAAAAKVPATAKIIPKASTSTNKNSATATVSGLKPGQKVKVTVNVKPRP